VVPLCPTSREICSIGTPASESSETKLCRSSRGVHVRESSPAASTTLRKERRTCEASAGVPACDANTRSLSCPLVPAACLSWSWRALWLRSTSTPFAASFGCKPYGAATAAHSTPGDRPPAVPVVSRCRARQYHGRAVTVAPVRLPPGNVTVTGPERRALSGSAPPASRV